MHNKFFKLVISILILAVIGFEVTSVAAETTDSQDTVDVTRVIVTGPYNENEAEDANWPIIWSETEVIRTEDGQEIISTLIIRRQPRNGDDSEICDQEESLATSLDTTIASNCTFQDNDSIERSWAYSGVRSYVKHFASVYTHSGSGATLWKPYKVEVWWTRTSSSWTVKNAYLLWGCEGCVNCAGQIVNPVYQESPHTPGWNGNTSHIYTYTSSSFPIMKGSLFGPVRATEHSDVYLNNVYQSHLEVEAYYD
jgi:hypothetical protein